MITDPVPPDLLMCLFQSSITNVAVERLKLRIDGGYNTSRSTRRPCIFLLQVAQSAYTRPSSATRALLHETAREPLNNMTMMMQSTVCEFRGSERNCSGMIDVYSPTWQQFVWKKDCARHLVTQQEMRGQRVFKRGMILYTGLTSSHHYNCYPAIHLNTNATFMRFCSSFLVAFEIDSVIITLGASPLDE